MALERLHTLLRERSPLMVSAHANPRGLAQDLAEAIASATLEELRSTEEVRREVVWALEHLCHRNIPFEPIEAALCRLAIAENETFGNNATSVWSALFLVHLNPTHHEIAVRLRRLRERLDDSGTTLLAIKGAEIAASREMTGLAYTEADKADGEWKRPTRQEAFEAKRTAWGWLAEFSKSTDAPVAAQARRVMAKLLRESLFLGLGSYSIPSVLDSVRLWDAAERSSLRNTLEVIERFDGDELRKHVELLRAFKQLRDELVAVSFEDRLRDLVCRHSLNDAGAPGGEAYERAVVAEGLEGGVPILSQLDLLFSQDAVRAVPFMRSLGQLDAGWVVLQPVLARVLTEESELARDLLASYVGGLSVGQRSGDVDDLLVSWNRDVRLQPVVVLSVWRAVPSVQRARILIDLLAGAPSPGARRAAFVLSMGPWCGQLEPACFRELVDVLRKPEREDLQLVALELLARLVRYQEVNVPLDWTTAALSELVEVTAGREIPNRNIYSWKHAGAWLLEVPDWSHVTRAISLAIGAADHGTSHAGWELLLKAAAKDSARAWEALEKALSDSLAAGTLYRIRWHEPVLEQLPLEQIVAWIGDDDQRAAAVAHGAFVHGPILSPLARYIVERFGEQNTPARVLAGRAHSTLEAVTSLTVFALNQRRNALAWASAASGEAVRRWAERLAEQFSRDVERFRLDEGVEAGYDSEEDGVVARLHSDIAAIRSQATERVAALIEKGVRLSAELQAALDSAATDRSRNPAERGRSIAVVRMSGTVDGVKGKLLDEWFGQDFDVEMARPIATLYYDKAADLDELLRRLEHVDVPQDPRSDGAESISWALAAIQAQLKLQPAEVGEERARRCVEIADRFGDNERLRSLVREIQLLTRGKSTLEPK